jgi:chemotaxis protein CheD
MELLINEMLAHGAAAAARASLWRRQSQRRAGADRLRNAEFAAVSGHEGITIVREDLGGNHARRVDFRPARGQVRCRTAENNLVSRNQPPAPRRACGGDVELF